MKPTVCTMPIGRITLNRVHLSTTFHPDRPMRPYQVWKHADGRAVSLGYFKSPGEVRLTAVTLPTVTEVVNPSRVR